MTDLLELDLRYNKKVFLWNFGRQTGFVSSYEETNGNYPTINIFITNRTWKS